MTQNQIAAAKAAEDARHNLATEKLQAKSNEITAQHYTLSDQINKEHYERSDAATKAHYERSDQASLISANASAINADTNRKKYEMEYDIEYNWNGDFGYPEGMPMSAMKNNAGLELQTLINPVFVRPTVPAYVTDEYTGKLREPTTREVAIGIDMHTSPATILAQDKATLENVKLKSESAKNIGTALNQVTTGVFGKSGLYNSVTHIVDDVSSK